jgi:hypothetical protein
MKCYKLDPQNCENRPNGDVIRPFKLFKCDCIDGGEYSQCLAAGKNVELNINKLQTDEANELEKFCEQLSVITGKNITKDDLSDIMKTRKIIIEE